MNFFKASPFLLSFMVGAITQLSIDTLFIRPLHAWSFIVTFWISVALFVYVKYDYLKDTILKLVMTRSSSLNPTITNMIGNAVKTYSSSSNPSFDEAPVKVLQVPYPAKVRDNCLIIPYLYDDRPYKVFVPFHQNKDVYKMLDKMYLRIRSPQVEENDIYINITQQVGVPLLIKPSDIEGGYLIQGLDKNGVVVFTDPI